MLMLKERRKEAGISQEELAKKSGVSRGTIAAIESENKEVSTGVNTLAKLAAALNCKVEDFFCA